MIHYHRYDHDVTTNQITIHIVIIVGRHRRQIRHARQLCVLHRQQKQSIATLLPRRPAWP
jgi:hypothetical protein